MRNRLLCLCCLGAHLAVAQSAAAKAGAPDDVVQLDKLEVKGGPVPAKLPGL